MRIEQSVPSNVWNITHNLNNKSVGVNCWVDVDGMTVRIYPNIVHHVDANVCQIEFLHNYAGYIEIAV